MSFTLFNAKNIADALADEVQKQIEDDERQNELPNLFPFVLIAVVTMMGEFFEYTYY